MNVDAEKPDVGQPLVSVIVPVYNIEHLIGACVASIVNQSYQNLDIVLVDDGSTDASGEICRSLSASDSRVRVLRKSNGGLSDARNYGIRDARGEYITCVDGDDIVALDYVKALLAPLVREEADISAVRFVRVLEGYEPDALGTSDVASYALWDTQTALERLFLQQGITTSAWGKMYRRDAFDDIEYPVGSIHEDLPVTYRLVAKSRAVAAVDLVGYYYVQRKGSITGRADFARRADAIRFTEEAVTYAEIEHPSLVTAAKARALMECVYLISQVPKLSQLRALDPVVAKTVRNYSGAVVSSRNVPAGQRITALTARVGLSAVWLLMRARVVASDLRTTLRSSR